MMIGWHMSLVKKRRKDQHKSKREKNSGGIYIKR